MADVKELNCYVVEWSRTGGQSNNNLWPVYVRLLRRRKGLLRSVLAAQTGIKEATLVAIENDLISWEKIEPNQRQSLENSLGMSYQEFLCIYSYLVSKSPDEQVNDSICFTSELEATLTEATEGGMAMYSS